MLIRHHLFRSRDDAGGSAAAPVATPAAAAPAPADPSPAAPVASPAPAAPAASPAPVAAAPAAKAEPTADGKPAADTKADEVKGIWPENWRETVSKDDAKKLARLSRYASPEAALDALIEAQNRIAKGELKPTLGKNATPEQIKEWREANGIPETADKYDLGDAAKGIGQEALGLLLADAHATNQTPEQVKATLGVYGKVLKAAQDQRAENDTLARQAAEDTLRAEWGPEYRRNLNIVHGMLDGTTSQKLKDAVLDSRLPDGSRFGDSPEVMQLLVSLALIQNPAGVVVPGGSADPLKGTEDRIAQIEKMMRTDRKAYDNDAKISGPNGEYQQLLVAREKLKDRQR